MRVMVRFLKNQPTSQNRMEEPTSTAMSMLLIFPIGRGDRLALHPSTRIINRLLPMTLPMAIPGFFFKAARDGSCQFRQRGTSGHQCKSDDRVADT